MIQPYASAADIERVFLAAKTGEQIVYHVGNLSADRLTDDNLHEVAAYVQVLQGEGRADLSAQRLAPGVYRYSLTKRATLGRPCDYENGQDQAYKVLSAHEPPRVPRIPRERPTVLAQKHLSPRQQHELERLEYTDRGAPVDG